MNKSVIIIGKGYSVTKCTKEFVDSHDEVAIVNSPVYGEYEKLISDHADYLFTNKTGMLYNHSQINKLGLKEMVFTGCGHQKFQRLSKHVKMVYPNPNIFDHFDNNIGFWPNSGLQAMYYLIKTGKYNKISLVGFDFYQLGLPPYYFDPKYAFDEIKHLWSGDWKDNEISVKNLHDEEKTIDFLIDFIKENKDINFNIITLNETFKDVSLKNLTLINDELN